MKLHSLDIAIIGAYFVTTVLIGLWVSRRGAKDLNSYFPGGQVAAVVPAGHLRRLRDV
jgi:solute:Na+ symporter, SSS family